MFWGGRESLCAGLQLREGAGGLPSHLALRTYRPLPGRPIRARWPRERSPGAAFTLAGPHHHPSPTHTQPHRFLQAGAGGGAGERS